jgi:hypothetical protein
LDPHPTFSQRERGLKARSAPGAMGFFAPSGLRMTTFRGGAPGTMGFFGPATAGPQNDSVSMTALLGGAPGAMEFFAPSGLRMTTFLGGAQGGMGFFGLATAGPQNDTKSGGEHARSARSKCHGILRSPAAGGGPQNDRVTKGAVTASLWYRFGGESLISVPYPDGSSDRVGRTRLGAGSCPAAPGSE